MYMALIVVASIIAYLYAGCFVTPFLVYGMDVEEEIIPLALAFWPVFLAAYVGMLIYRKVESWIKK